MAQNASARPPVAVSFCTSMSRPDAALALASAFILDGRRVVRAGAILDRRPLGNARVHVDLVDRHAHVPPLVAVEPPVVIGELVAGDRAQPRRGL